MTHYLPPFTQTIGVRQRAACGTDIFPSQHSAEPDCAACKTWLTTTHDEDEETARALEAEYPEYRGRLAADR